jgi:hypothetical protein
MISFFHKIIDVFDALNIPYMLSGSIAMGVYIVPRATRDFDFVIYLQSKDVIDFVSNFKDGYYCDLESVQEAVKQKNMFNIIDHTSGFKADFMILKDNEFRQLEFKRRVKMAFFDKTVYLVSVEDLLLSKLIWIQEIQAAIQIEDIKNLSQLETLDWDYVNEWILKLNLKTFNLI